jgi:hypothetical protein
VIDPADYADWARILRAVDRTDEARIELVPR